MTRQEFLAKKVLCGSAPQTLGRGNRAKLRAGRVLSVQAAACTATAHHQSACGYSVDGLYVPAQGFAPRPYLAHCADR